MALSTKTIFITSVGTGTFTVPKDFISLVSIQAIGGGGCYVLTNYSASPNTQITYQ